MSTENDVDGEPTQLLPGQEIETAPLTVPAYQISVQGGCFENEEAARTFGKRLGFVIEELSRHVDLSTLDGVSVALDYPRALAELDRGRGDLQPLAASTAEADGVIGAAMAPSVLRDGKIKTHLVFHVGLISGLSLDDVRAEEWQFGMHALAHECAHVEVTAATDHAFPGTILQERFDDHLRARRWEVINAAWDEYGATRISAGFGMDPTEGYIDIFVQSLLDARQSAHDAITAYRTHSDVDRVLAEVIGAYGNLVKFAGYLLGTLDGRGGSIEDYPVLRESLKGHWFAERFERLHHIFRTLWGRWGEWESRNEFEPLADIFIEIMEEGGVFLAQAEGGGMRVDIPLWPENTPYHPIFAPFGRR